MKALTTLVFALALGLFGPGAWAQQYTPDAGTYGMSNSMTLGRVYEGTVVQVRPVRIEASNTAAMTGNATGAALGGLLGSRAGNGNGRIATGILGAVLGAWAGNTVADHVAGYNATEIVVAMSDHRLVSITQAGDASLAPGEPVYVIQSGGTTRVVARSAGQGEPYIQK